MIAEVAGSRDKDSTAPSVPPRVTPPSAERLKQGVVQTFPTGATISADGGPIGKTPFCPFHTTTPSGGLARRYRGSIRRVSSIFAATLEHRVAEYQSINQRSSQRHTRARRSRSQHCHRGQQTLRHLRPQENRNNKNTIQQAIDRFSLPACVTSG